MPKTRTKSYKAVASAIGATATAVTTAMATVSIVLGDDVVDAAEIGSVVTALAVLVGTVYAVWRTPNPPVDDPAVQSVQNRANPTM